MRSQRQNEESAVSRLDKEARELAKHRLTVPRMGSGVEESGRQTEAESKIVHVECSRPAVDAVANVIADVDVRR